MHVPASAAPCHDSGAQGAGGDANAGTDATVTGRMIGPLARLLTKYSHVNWALADQAMVSAANFATGIILARFLGLEEFGRFTLVWMLVLFVNAIQRAVIVSPMMSIGPNDSEEPAYYGAVGVQQIVFGAGTFALVWGTAAAAAAVFPDWRISGLAFPLACTSVACQSQEFLRRNFFTRGRGGAAFATDALRYLGQLAILLWLFSTAQMDSARALWTIATLAGLAAISFLPFLGPVAWQAETIRAVTARHWQSGRWLVGSAIMQWTSGQFFFIVAGATLGVSAVGALRAAQSIMGVLNVLFRGLENVVQPRAAQLYRGKNTRALVSYLWRITRWGGLLTVVIAAIAAVAPEYWLELAYGAEFARYDFLLRWYALIYVITFLAVPCGNGLRTLEAAENIFWAYVTATVFSLIFAYPLIAFFELKGAIIGILFSQSLLHLYITLAFHREVKRLEQTPENIPRRLRATNDIEVFKYDCTNNERPSMGIRNIVQNGIDRIQFHLDVFPGLPYQPLPWIGLRKSRRGIGTEDRWDAISSAISDTPIWSALDIGSNAGFFSFKTGQNNIPTIGVEMDDRLLRIARYTAKRLNTDNVSFLGMVVNNRNVHLLPTVDLVLLLSVWHHWVQNFHLDAATELLATIWSKCRSSLFFESGESEMPEEYGLPEMTPTPKEWLASYLHRSCPGSEVHHLGAFKAFGPGGNEKENVIFRNLFQVKRS